MRRSLAAAFACSLFFAPFAHAQQLLGGLEPSAATSLEDNVERPGADILVRPMPKGDALSCQRLCEVTKGCQAFTFEKPAADGAISICRVKRAAPEARASSCCVSGVVGKGAPVMVAAAPPAPAPAQAEEPAFAPTVKMAAAAPAKPEAIVAAPALKAAAPAPQPVDIAFAADPTPGKVSAAAAPQTLTAPQLAAAAPIAAPAITAPPEPAAEEAPPPIRLADLLQRRPKPAAKEPKPEPAPKPAPAAKPEPEPAPVQLASAPAPGETLASWPEGRGAPTVMGMCLTQEGDLRWSEVGRALIILTPCGKGEPITLKDGMLAVGYHSTHQALATVPVGAGCETLRFRSEARAYDMRVCRARSRDARETMAVDFTEADRAVIQSLAPRGEKSAVMGAPLMAQYITFNQPAEKRWELVVATGQIRLAGTNRCLSAPVGDATPGAPVYLDDCATPIINADGQRGPADARSRFLQE
jgi:hypothetical protein